MNWTARHASALSVVFSALDEEGLPWMILRNYQGLPDNNSSKDIDIMVEKASFLKASEVIIKNLKKYGCTHYESTIFQCIWCYTFYFIDSKNSPYSIKIDLFDGFIFRGAEVIGFDEIYSNKVRYNNISVPNEFYNGFMLWIKPLMTGGFVKQKYRNEIESVISKYPEEFKDLMNRVIGSTLEQKIWPLLEEFDLDGTVQFKSKMRRFAWSRYFYRYPYYSLVNTIDHYYKEIKRRLRRPEASIISVIENDDLKKVNFNVRFVQKIATIMIKDDSNIIILDPHSEESPDSKRLFDKRIIGSVGENLITLYFFKSLKFIGSLFTLSYYWIAFIASYWLDMRKKCNAGKVFILRNSFYNYIFDDSVKTSSLPWWIRKLYLRMTPKSILIFSLNSNHNQKHSQLITLDSSRSIDMACDEAIKTLIKRSFKNI